MKVRNFRQFNEHIGTAGQPTADELTLVAEAGYKHVINFAVTPADSVFEDEREIVENLGMTYHPHPVRWKAPVRSEYEAFVDLMRPIDGEKVFVHCAANYRVTAYVALYAMTHLGTTRREGDEFIHSVWNPADYPEWDAIIKTIRAAIPV